MDSIDNDTVRDSSAYDNHGAIVDSPTVVGGIIGRSALEFGENSDRIDMEDNVLTPDDITLAAWVTPGLGSVDEGSPGIVTNKHGAEDGINLNLRNNYIRALVGNGTDHNSYIRTSWSFSAGNTYHVAVTHDSVSDENVLYVNGVREDSDTFGLAYTGDPKFQIGAFYLDDKDFEGIIDDVRIYDRTLSEDEIKALYNMRSSRLRTWNLGKGLVGHWSMDSIDNGMVRDSSGYGHHGDIIESPTVVEGVVGDALEFDDNGSENEDRVYVSSDDVFQFGEDDDFTMAAWVSIHEGISSYNAVLTCRSGGYDDSFGLQVRDDPSIEFRIRSSDSPDPGHGVSITHNVAFSVFFHAVAKYENAHMYLYVDGEEVSDTDYDEPEFVDSGRPVHIGSDNSVGGSGDGFDGRIEDARIYNRALSQQEIKGLYNKRTRA